MEHDVSFSLSIFKWTMWTRVDGSKNMSLDTADCTSGKSLSSSLRVSLISKHDQRVNSGCPQCGDVTCEQAHGSQSHGGCKVAERIPRWHLEEYGFNEAGQQ